MCELIELLIAIIVAPLVWAIGFGFGSLPPTVYIVEYKDFQGTWRLRGEYDTYQSALKRWRNHNLHCSYLVCRIRKARRV